MRLIAILLITILNMVPLIWFVPLMAKHDPLALFSQYIGCVALISMGLTQLMATRMRWMEPVLGGLDQIYVQHKWLGISAMIAVLLHDTIDAELDGLGRETFLVDLAETLGELSLYGLLILVVVTLTTFIPYHLWRITHKFMGAFFAASALHYLFILKPFENGEPLGLYVGGFCLLGIVSYLYTLIPFNIVEGRHRYTVSYLERTGDALAITLDADKKGLSHKPGQFAFIRFDRTGRDEIHPFTISKGRDDNRELRFTIKPLGDDTRALAQSIEVGTRARISPAHGHFTRPRKTTKPEIWIAGGIGVTPFAAFAQALPTDCAPVHFFYCVSHAAQAVHLKEFEETAERCANFHLHLIASKAQGRLQIGQIEAVLERPLAEHIVYYCGPEAMRKSLQKLFSEIGLNPRQFKYEEFEIRSGLLFTPLLNWLMDFAGRLVADRLQQPRNRHAR